MMRYCVETFVDDGVLLFNLLTRELVLLSKQEHDRMTELDYLWEHWFVVPEDANEKEYADLVKWVLSARQKKSGAITGYTIFPTTDCNARCFYCFELGRSRVPMSRETALKVVEYIKTHCQGKVCGSAGLAESRCSIKRQSIRSVTVCARKGSNIHPLW